jgi:hypothetical protein
VSVKSRFWPAAVLVLAALAYSPLLRESAFTPSRYGFETALFRPAPMPALLTIAIAIWLAWRRRAHAAPVGRALAIALFALAASASIWAALTRTTDLLFASAAAMLVALGGRAMALPCRGPPARTRAAAPLEAELVWQLQRWRPRHRGAPARDRARADRRQRGAVARRPAVLGDRRLQRAARDPDPAARRADRARAVRSRGAREWLVVLVAPLLGHALNVARIAWVAAGEHRASSPTWGFQGDHTPQGGAGVGRRARHPPRRLARARRGRARADRSGERRRAGAPRHRLCVARSLRAGSRARSRTPAAVAGLASRRAPAGLVTAPSRGGDELAGAADRLAAIAPAPGTLASALVSVARSRPSFEAASARGLVATLPMFTEIEARRTLAAFAAPAARPAP